MPVIEVKLDRKMVGFDRIYALTAKGDEWFFSVL
jgi:hypothetical protein